MSSMAKQLSLSVDEIAMALCLINRADVGKALLMNAYGNTISANSLEDRLAAASHSLLARQLVAISKQGTVALEEPAERFLFPLLKFTNLLQVTVTSPEGANPDVTNIYLGLQDTFTALRVHTGVVYQMLQARFEEIPLVIRDVLHLPTELPALPEEPVAISVNMADLVSVIHEPAGELAAALRKSGLPDPLARIVALDLETPRIRGSVVITNISSQNFADKDINDPAAGILFLLGNRYSWVFKFDHTQDAKVAQLMPCTDFLFESMIADLVNRKVENQ